MIHPYDVVVTVPKTFQFNGLRGLAAWISEGDAAGDADTGQEWWFTTYGPLPTPNIIGSRCYIVCEGKLRGYAIITECKYDQSRVRNGQAPIAFIRKGGAVAVTIDQPIQGFRGYRRRWWNREDERPFPEWRKS